MTNVVVVGIIVVVVDIYCFCAIIKEEESQKKEKKTIKNGFLLRSVVVLGHSSERTVAQTHTRVC